MKTKGDKQQEEPDKVTRGDKGRTLLSRTLKKRWAWWNISVTDVYVGTLRETLAWVLRGGRGRSRGRGIF